MSAAINAFPRQSHSASRTELPQDRLQGHKQVLINSKQLSQRLRTLLGGSTGCFNGAAAAIALALPTSAWHPPVAPAIIALFATTIPKAAEVKRKRTVVHGSSSLYRQSRTQRRARFHSLLLLESHTQAPLQHWLLFGPTQQNCTPLEYYLPDNVFPRSRYFFIFNASPPVKPVGENTPLLPRFVQRRSSSFVSFFHFFLQMYPHDFAGSCHFLFNHDFRNGLLLFCC